MLLKALDELSVLNMSKTFEDLLHKAAIVYGVRELAFAVANN